MKTPDQKYTLEDLKPLAFRVREHCIRMATDGGCFIGASLSAVDVVAYLYTQFLNIKDTEDPNRDYFFLSKGHDVPALYGTWAELGWMERDRLKNHLKTSDSVYWHPNRKIPGVEFHSGSLGHLLPVAIGVALDLKIRKATNKVVVLLGDGELNEGSIWESLLVANAHKLDNLVLVVDRNQFQANAATEELIPLEPLEDKFRAFHCQVKSVDGHDFEAMDQTFKSLPYSSSGPSCVIAVTRRGKGLPSIEARADRWFCNFTHNEVEQLLSELKSGEATKLQSETLTVR